MQQVVKNSPDHHFSTWTMDIVHFLWDEQWAEVRCPGSASALSGRITLQTIVSCLCLHGWKGPNKSVLWSIKLWCILAVMWKQSVYKMLSHNSGMIPFRCLRRWSLQTARFFARTWVYGSFRPSFLRLSLRFGIEPQWHTDRNLHTTHVIYFAMSKIEQEESGQRMKPGSTKDEHRVWSWRITYLE